MSASTAGGRSDQVASGHVARAARDRRRIAVGRRHRRRARAHQVAGQVAAARVELQHGARRRADRVQHGRDQRRVAGASHLREAVGGDAQRRRPRLGDVDVRPPERRLARQGQADDARRAETVDLAPRVRRAGRIGVGDVDVDAVVARLHVELDAGRQPARGPAQRGQRARQLGAEQRAGGDVDDVVRRAARGSRAFRPGRPPAWRDRGSRTAGWRRSRPGGLPALSPLCGRGTTPARARRSRAWPRAARRARRAATGSRRRSRTADRAAARDRRPGARSPSARPTPPCPSPVRCARARARPARRAGRT